MPDHIKATFQRVIAELELYNFQIASYQLVQGIVPNERVWGIILQHQSLQTYAGLTIRQPVDTIHPVTISLGTVFADDTTLATQNLPEQDKN